MSPGEDRRGKGGSSLFAAVLAVLLVGLCVLCPATNSLLLRPILANFDSRYASSHVDPVPFDRDLWLAGKARHRVGMAHHLTNNNLLVGKTRSELVEVLGEPDIDRPGDEGMRWLLGFHAKGLFDETLWLGVTLGNDGKVKGSLVWMDWYDPRRD